MQFYWFFRLFWLAVWGCARFSGVSMSKSVWSKNQNRELVTCHYNLAEKLLFTQMQKRYTEDRVLCSFFKQRNRRNHMIFSFGSGYLRTSNKCTQKKKKRIKKRKNLECAVVVWPPCLFEKCSSSRKNIKTEMRTAYEMISRSENRETGRDTSEGKEKRVTWPHENPLRSWHTHAAVCISPRVCV